MPKRSDDTRIPRPSSNTDRSAMKEKFRNLGAVLAIVIVSLFVCAPVRAQQDDHASKPADAEKAPAPQSEPAPAPTPAEQQTSPPPTSQDPAAAPPPPDAKPSPAPADQSPAVPAPDTAAPAVPASAPVKRSAAPRTAKKKPAAAAPVQSASKAPAKSSSASANKSAEAQLEQWCRALKEKDPGAYEHLTALAQKKSAGELGQRAALALGYYDFTRAQYAAAAASLESATADPIVGEYALYWRAEAVRAQGDNARAAALFETFRSNYPTSVMSEQAVGSLAETELALGQPDKAIAALGPDSVVSARSQFLFLRAQAWEQAKQPEAAVRDYQAVVYRYPTSTESRESELKEKFLAKDLGARVPQVPVDLQQSRANQLYSAHNWLAALDAYTTLLPNLSGSDRDRVLLRQIQCRVAMGANSNELLSLKISDPDADAERLYNLSQSYRSHAQEPEMLDAVEQAARRAPQSGWTEQALFATGNYYWVALERSQAASYYSRVAASFPDANDADAAQWRVAWVAHLARTPDAAALLEAHLRRYPTSTFTPDALYWLGREAERAGDSPLARGYYVKLELRYPRNYFQQLAQARLQSLGGGPHTDAPVLSVIPSPPPVRPLGDSVPPSAAAQNARANALRSIAIVLRS